MPPTDKSLRSLTYCSTAVKKYSEFDLSLLLLRAQSFNTSVNVTGLLMSRPGEFLQTIEGVASDLDTVMDRIRRDQNHDDINVLADSHIVQRVYPNWAMASNVDMGTSRVLSFLQMVAKRGNDVFVPDQRNMIQKMISFAE